MAIKVIHSLHLNKDVLSISWDIDHKYTWWKSTKIGIQISSDILRWISIILCLQSNFSVQNNGYAVVMSVNN